ncbi:ATP-binding protein [Marinobacter sp. HL-58]|uniref:ATP-binding protein n=1 Tax=Marinobacter sp. HL-58 TaxID=1479237 RepID=UPI0006D9C718|nr:ATP-binding protein [Marinobacter sp. HL-58]KPP99895.1 MAG: two component signal transduction system histidine kinase [Marinobacter sp. HL-58]
MKRPVLNAREMFRSLRLTLLLSIVVPLMVFSGVAIYLGLGAVEENLNDRLREDLELVARAVSGPLSQAMSDGDEIVMGESLKSIFRIGRVFGASVFDEDGRQVASLGVADTDVTRSVSAERVISSGELDGAFRQVDGVSVFSQFTPLFAADGRIQGLLQVTRKRSDFHELVASSRIWAVGIWSVVSLMVILVVVLGHYGAVGRHVSRLLEIMERMAPGHWRVDEEPAGPRELRQIHEGLRDMGERMMHAETEIRESVERERELAEQLEYQEKVAMIGRVAGGVAHELGAPLSVIQGRANILGRGDLAEGERRHLKDIEHQVERMTLIIQQLLDCFRHVPDSRRKTNLAATARELLDRIREEPRCQGVEIRSEIPFSEAYILAEPTRLEMACLNIIRNACQAARSVVTVTLADHDGLWELRVDDDGPGVDEAMRERIFEPFYSTRAAGEGTGLGLAVVGSVLKEHSGRIEVGSSPEGGCRMSTLWPAFEQNDNREEVSHDQ